MQMKQMAFFRNFWNFKKKISIFLESLKKVQKLY